jgi:hypothetical protein
MSRLVYMSFVGVIQKPSVMEIIHLSNLVYSAPPSTWMSLTYREPGRVTHTINDRIEIVKTLNKYTVPARSYRVRSPKP